MKLNTFYCFVFIFCIYISLSSAKLAVDLSNFNINKSINEIRNINITIINQGGVDFVNISIENNIYVNFTKIDELKVGERKNITLNFFGNEDVINKELRIKGFYLSSLSESHDVYTINADVDGIENCHSLSLIKGDSILFKNNEINYDISIIRSGETSAFAVILKNSNYTLPFPIAGEFTYSFYLENAFLIDTCVFPVREPSGLVNDRNLDALINVTLKISHPATNISTLLFKTSYNMRFFEEKTDVLKITNVGNNIAKNIRLTGEWFEFSPNNFDLDIGQDINVNYKIKPLNFISNTNQTNRTYNKNVLIEGNNFNPQAINFSIFIEFTEIGDNFISNGTNLLDIITQGIEQYCKENPTVCGVTPTVVINLLIMKQEM